MVLVKGTLIQVALTFVSVLNLEFTTNSSFSLGIPDKDCEVTCDGHAKYDYSESSTSHPVSSRSPFLAYGSGEVVVLNAYEDVVGLAGYTVGRTH